MIFMKPRILKTIGLSIFGLFILGACQGKHSEQISENKPKQDSNVIEVIYFYGKQRCSTCMAMGKYAKEALDSAFAEKTNDGSIIFKAVDITSPEGEKLADLFEVSSSSLYIVDNNPDNPERVDMTSFGFRNARSNSHIYKQGIIDQINKFLD